MEVTVGGTGDFEGLSFGLVGGTAEADLKADGEGLRPEGDGHCRAGDTERRPARRDTELGKKIFWKYRF